MQTTGTHIAYFHLCHRKLWLFHHGIRMEHESELVAMGKFIDETTYTQRAEKWKALAIEGIKIDHFDPKNKVVREIKKSQKKEAVHIAQLKYYLFVLWRNGVEINHGLLEYPKLKITEKIQLNEADKTAIPLWEKAVETIVRKEDCPPRINQTMCKKCAYYEFCYAI